jgi:glycosyltransferase involved in cell wall biosynthesis
MISILIPIFNGIEYINESITSVLEQTYNNWEIIIAVNGHPENSFVFNIAKEYENLDSRIRVLDFYNVNGKANTLNDMLIYCKYDYVAILDVDDIWLPTKLEKQSEKLGLYDVIGTKCVYFENLEGVIAQVPHGDISNFDFKQLNPVINSSAILRKELCKWDEDFAGVEDYHLWVRLHNQNKSFFNFEDVLVKHRIHPRSAFNTQDHSKKIVKIKNM